MASFQEDQIELLSSKKGIIKIVRSGKESNQIKVEDPDWKEELKILLEFELNKVANQGEYKKDSIPGIVRFYLEEDNARLKVKSQELEFYPSGKLKGLRSKKENENFLFSSNSSLSIELDPTGIMKSMTLDFEKKVIMMKPENFSLALSFY